MCKCTTTPLFKPENERNKPEGTSHGNRICLSIPQSAERYLVRDKSV